MTGCAGQRYHKTVGNHALPAASPAPYFVRPLDGPVLARYGAREEGVTLKGMVVQGAEGQEVRAAQQGLVAYVDESLRGYGKTIVLEHDGGYSTVYARASEILVNVGDRVRKGQSIARVGRLGRGGQPQVYFEVRENARPVDPQPLLN